jgi:hypothetical protein
MGASSFGSWEVQSNSFQTSSYFFLKEAVFERFRLELPENSWVEPAAESIVNRNKD